MMLIALMRKELQVLARDVHALLALFLMPLMFIVIMSLALKDVYDPPLRKLPYALDVRDTDVSARELAVRWQARRGVARMLPDEAGEALRRGDLRYVIRIEPGFSAALTAVTPPRSVQARVIADPALDIGIFRATEAELAALVGELRAEAVQERFMGVAEKGGQSIRHMVAAERMAGQVTPTSVQQNVPAWLVFGMFFVVTAVAGLFVQERANGTLGRLTSLGVSPQIQLLSKGLPYLVVNALQAAVMLAAGVWLMPLVGGEAISLAGVDWPALSLMLLAISLAAVGMALALACLLRTHAQVSTVGPILNILMAAVGGVMVPRFVMPDLMQQLALFSPMNWALEGLLTVLLRQGSIAEIAPHAAALTLFAAAMLAVAAIRSGRKTR